MSNSKVKKSILFTILSLPLLAGVGVYNNAHALPHAARSSFAHHAPMVAAGVVTAGVIASSSSRKQNQSIGINPIEHTYACKFIDSGFRKVEVDSEKYLGICKAKLNAVAPEYKLGKPISITDSTNGSFYVVYELVQKKEVKE